MIALVGYTCTLAEFGDNQIVIALWWQLRYHARTKHVEIPHYFIKLENENSSVTISVTNISRYLFQGPSGDKTYNLGVIRKEVYTPHVVHLDHARP